MIGSVVAAFFGLALGGLIGLAVLARVRSSMSYQGFVRVTQLATFIIFVGLFGVVVGCMFWVAS